MAADGRIRVQHFGPRRGEAGGGGIAAVIDMMLWPEHRSVVAGHVPTGRRSRRFHSVDLFVLALGRLVALRLGCRRPVLVHVHLADGGSLRREGTILRLARALGLKTVATVHASHLDQVLEEDRRWLVRVLHGAHVVHALGPQAARLLQPVMPLDAKLVVIPNGVRLPPAPTPAGDSPARVLFAGEVGVRKGVDVLLTAWADLLDSHPHAELVIAGPPRDLEPGRQRGVSWLGGVPPSTVAALLDGCRTAVLPSRREAFPMFVVEAMAHGRPVVATRVGDVPAFLEEPWLIEPEDPVALADRMRRLLVDRELASEVGSANRRVVEKRLSSAAVLAALDEVYLELAGRPRTPEPAEGGTR